MRDLNRQLWVDQLIRPPMFTGKPYLLNLCRLSLVETSTHASPDTRVTIVSLPTIWDTKLRQSQNSTESACSLNR